MKILIEPYNTNWPSLFKEIKSELSVILNNNQPIIEHIGSTSIPDLSAKPIIDVAIGINHIDELDSLVKPLTTNSYIYIKAFNKAMPNRRFFIKLNNTQNTFKSIYNAPDEIPHEEWHKNKIAHIHIWELNSPDWVRHIAFKEYLLHNPVIRKEYGQLKNDLSKLDWIDGNEYNTAKNDFIKTIELKAIQWYEKNYSQQDA